MPAVCIAPFPLNARENAIYDLCLYSDKYSYEESWLVFDFCMFPIVDNSNNPYACMRRNYTLLRQPNARWKTNWRTVLPRSLHIGCPSTDVHPGELKTNIEFKTQQSFSFSLAPVLRFSSPQAHRFICRITNLYKAHFLGKKKTIDAFGTWKMSKNREMAIFSTVIRWGIRIDSVYEFSGLLQIWKELRKGDHLGSSLPDK